MEKLWVHSYSDKTTVQLTLFNIKIRTYLSAVSTLCRDRYHNSYMIYKKVNSKYLIKIFI